MSDMPSAVRFYKRTAEFDNESVPNGLLKAHRTKSGTWGKIVVLKGVLEYRILEPEYQAIELSPNKYGVIEPTILHEVEPLTEVRFCVEFYR